MTQNLPALGFCLLGLLLGLRHATDPDHVVAVTAILARERRLSAAQRIGLVWGLGHALTILLLGGFLVGFRVALPARVGVAAEWLVAALLIGLGLSNLRTWLRPAGAPSGPHSHPHFHGWKAHSHAHAHASAQADHHTLAADQPASYSGMTRALAVGMIHGLAGSGAIALLVLQALRPLGWALLYLLTFSVGTLAGMALVTTLLALPLCAGAHNIAGFDRKLALSSGVLSVGFGLLLVYQGVAAAALP